MRVSCVTCHGYIKWSEPLSFPKALFFAGDPKGVVLRHKTMVTAVQALHDYLEQANLQVTHVDSVLSFLPLAHIFGRVVEEFMISCGARIGYWQVTRHFKFGCDRFAVKLVSRQFTRFNFGGVHLLNVPPLKEFHVLCFQALFYIFYYYFDVLVL